jgi:hypothetical protein
LELFLMPARRRVKKAPYIRLYCHWWQDARIAGLTRDAAEVWLRAIAYSKAERLDGLMPEHTLLFLFPGIDSPPSVITAELVAAGCWSPVDGGWEIHQHGEYQTTAAEDDAERESTRQRKRDQRARDAAETNGHLPKEEPSEPSRRDDVAEPPSGGLGSPAA